MINRTIIVVLDSFGVGELPDADKYGDVGANTLGHIYELAKPKLTNMKKLGLYNIDGLTTVSYTHLTLPTIRLV